MQDLRETGERADQVSARTLQHTFGVKTAVVTFDDETDRPAADALPAGAMAGPWVVEHELGRGGMGAVYAVVHSEIGKRAALKVVHGHLLATGFNADRMLLEAKVVNQVDHPNIVDIFETGRLADGRPYIVMERLEGQSLAVRAKQAEIPPDRVIAILLQVGDALIAAHAAGIVHRDLKLDNVFLVDNPDDPGAHHVKLLDWGIAKDIVHDVRHTLEGTLVGTPQYLSPEQAAGKPVSPQTDVYSLGVMAYELFLDQLPFVADTAAEIMTMHLRSPPRPASELWPEIPPALEQLLHAMLAKSPDHRPAMRTVVDTLAAVRDGLQHPPVAPPAAHGITSVLPRPIAVASSIIEWCPCSRWPTAFGVFAIASTLAMAVITRAGDRSPVAPVELAPPPVVEPATPRSASIAFDEGAPEVTEPAVAAAPPAHRVAPRHRAVAAIVELRPLDPDGTLESYR